MCIRDRCILVGAISLAAGVAFGGARVLLRRYFPGPVFGRSDQAEFISLDLAEPAPQRSSAHPPLRDTIFRVVVPCRRLRRGDRTGELPCHARPCRATKISFIPMISLEDDQLYQLVPDHNRGGCRAFYRMPPPVPQSDAGTSVQSLGAVPVGKPLPPTGTGKPRRDFVGW